MKFSLSILCGVGLLTLSACEKTKEQFDFSKKAPDEFSVTTRAPLAMPSSLGTLPKPRPGAPRPQERATDTQAKQALFGDEATRPLVTDGSISQGENILLEKTGALETGDNIRDIVDGETEELVKENTSTFDKIRGKLGSKTQTPATVVDPTKEVERIRNNQQTGAPITTGSTPTLKQ